MTEVKGTRLHRMKESLGVEQATIFCTIEGLTFIIIQRGNDQFISGGRLIGEQSFLRFCDSKSIFNGQEVIYAQFTANTSMTSYYIVELLDALGVFDNSL